MFSSIVNNIDFQIVNEKTGEVRIIDGYHNELLNSFEVVRDNLPSILKCYIGTGSAPTVPTMTALNAKLPIDSPIAANFSSAPWNMKVNHAQEYIHYSATFTYEYALGAVQATVREIGFLFNNNSARNENTVMTRSVLTREGFDGIVVGADDRFTVNYTLNFFVSFKKYVFNVDIDHNGVLKPTRVLVQPHSIYPTRSTISRFIGLSDFVYQFLWSSGNTLSDTPNVTGSTWKDDSVLQETINTIKTDITPNPGYQRAFRVTVPASNGNFVKGLAIINYNDVFIRFDPPLPKDSDSLFTLDLHFRNVLPSNDRLAVLMANIDHSIPVFSLTVDVANRTFLDSQNFLTEGSFQDGIYQNVKGIDCVNFTNFITRNLSYKTKNLISADAGRTCSFRFVYYMTHAAHTANFMLEQDAGTPTRGYGRPLVWVQSSTNALNRSNLCMELAYLYGNYQGNGQVAPLFNLIGQWVELIIHHVPGKTTVFVNGVNNFQSSHVDYSTRAVLLAHAERWVLYGNPKTQDEPIDGVFLNHISYYDNYLVQPSGLPAVKTVAYPKTMLLLTFENGFPTNTDGFKFITQGAVTIEPTGGPGGIPAVSLGTGCIYVFLDTLMLNKDEEFTLEFEGFFTDQRYSIFCSDRSSQISPLSYGSDGGRVELFPSTGPWSPQSGAVVGSVNLSPYNVWASYTVVRRWENGVLKYYVAKNGVVVMTRTFEADGYSTAEFLGKLTIGTTGTNMWFSPSNGYKLANIRLTRGVINYFNPAGFSVPTGLRTVLI